MCLSHGRWVDLVDREGVRYDKVVARYVKGKPGTLDRYEHVVFARGRSVKASGALPQSLGDLRSVQRVLSVLEEALATTAPIQSQPAAEYEAF